MGWAGEGDSVLVSGTFFFFTFVFSLSFSLYDCGLQKIKKSKLKNKERRKIYGKSRAEIVR